MIRNKFSLSRIALWTALLLAIVGAWGLASWKRRMAAPDAATQARERAETPPGMAYVPGGEFWFGTNDEDADEDARPKRRVFVPSFYMDRTEVTNGEYRRFQPSRAFPAGEENLPVTNVTYDEAAAYAKWAGKRLPTEEEWEKAARGTEGRRYPWGNQWDKARVAQRVKRHTFLDSIQVTVGKVKTCSGFGASRVRPVGSVANSASPYGCVDMAGNAWEWVQGFYQGNPEMRILRGGAVGYGEKSFRTYEKAVEGSGAT